MKRTLCFLLAAIMALALVGCGGASSSAENSGGVPAGVEQEGSTQEQKDALEKAKEYMDLDGVSLSKNGLISLLESDGELSKELAEYAADHCNVDWDKEAVSAAYGALDLQPYSEKKLVGYLKALGFTDEQAAKAVSSCDTDWADMAAQKAKAYVAPKSYTHGALVSKLEDDGFTSDQAEYGASATE